MLESYLEVYCLFIEVHVPKSAEIFVMKILSLIVVLMMSQVFWDMMSLLVTVVVVVAL